jgi:hypothetical protein
LGARVFEGDGKKIIEYNLIFNFLQCFKNGIHSYQTNEKFWYVNEFDKKKNMHSKILFEILQNLASDLLQLQTDGDDFFYTISNIVFKGINIEYVATTIYCSKIFR